MKKHNQIKTLFAALCMLVSTAAIAQSISGTVTDETGSPLPGVNVTLEGTSQGASTDFDGNYSIGNLDNGSYNVSASYVGYKNASQAVTVDGDVTVNLQLVEDASALDEVVITGVVNPKSKLESSVSVSTINAKLIEQASPRSAGELFRNVPGIRAESSGGEGNGNFNVRGVPVSSGGSRYFQIQEDGLPLMLFGDTSFGNADNFLRIDSNIGRVEAIRGGSASTQSSNAPAGIINMISKTGKSEGGSVATTFGLDYQTSRLDFEYGTPLGNGLSYHIGGFLRAGEGPRKIGYQGNKGGQLKANITKEFESGYVRTYFKLLNDRSVMYMPMPVGMEGDKDNPKFSNLDGFDITNDAPQSVNIQNTYSMYDGAPVQNDMRDGNNPISKAIGAEFNFDLGNGFKFNGKARYSHNSGQWNAPFTAGVGTVDEIVSGARGSIMADTDPDDLERVDADGNPDPYIGAPGIQTRWGVTYADEAALLAANPNLENVVYADGTPFAPANGLAQDIRNFDVTIEDLSNFFSDIKVTKSFGDNLGVTLGMFNATQNTKIGWHWNSMISEVAGDGEAKLGLFDGFSEGGSYSFGQPAWSNCCQRKYNTVHNVNAPYVGVDLALSDAVNFDGSVRFENVDVNGTINSGQTSAVGVDYNSDGTISTFESSIPTIAGNAGQTVNDSYSFVSYSAGLNYKINDDTAVFGRYSKGASGRAADRNTYGANGKADTQFDELAQAEVGLKTRLDFGSVNVTAFASSTTEGLSNELNREVGAPFKARGVEVETALGFGDFSVNASATYTKALIDGGANEGNIPRRQAELVYNLSPAYSFGADKQHLLGFSLLGTTESYAQDDNVTALPGYAYLNAIAKIGLTEGLSLAFNVNNMLDTVGVTELEGNGFESAAGNVGRARTISGRSTTMSVQYKF